MNRNEIINIVNEGITAFRANQANGIGSEWACSSGMLEATVVGLLDAMITYRDEKETFALAEDFFNLAINHTLERFEEMKSLPPAE
jgi:hypothetical protein